MFVKILDRLNLSVKKESTVILEHQDHGQDLISDNSYTLQTPKQADYFLNDILQIREQEIDYFYVIDKKVDKQKINFKSIFNLFDDNIFLVDQTITLKSLFETYYISNTADTLQNISWLNVDDVDDVLPISLSSINSSNTASNGIYNIKSIIINTILSRKFTFKIDNDANNGFLNFIIQPQLQQNEINLNPLTTINVKLPQINTNITAVDLLLNVTHNVQVEDISGTPQTIEEPLRVEYERWVLTTDNQITNNLLAPNRVNPIKIDTLINSWNEDGDEPKPDNQELATTKLVDVSNYFWSFELINSRKMYNFNIEIGERLQVWYRGQKFITTCTGIEYMNNTTLYKFGFNRSDLVFRIKKNEKN